MADLTPDLQVYLSWRERPLSVIFLCQLLLCHLGPPRSTLWSSINLYVTGCLDCTLGAFLMSIPVEPPLLIPNAKPCKHRIGPDSDSLAAWQICPTIALPLCRRSGMPSPIIGQVSLAWSTQKLYTWPRVLKERICSSSTNPYPLRRPSHMLQQKAHSHWPPRAYLPRWLSWMRRPTGDQEVAGSTPAEVSNILSWRLIVKYFLRSFSPFRWFKKGSCQFLVKECAQYWLTT